MVDKVEVVKEVSDSLFECYKNIMEKKFIVFKDEKCTVDDVMNIIMDVALNCCLSIHQNLRVVVESEPGMYVNYEKLNAAFIEVLSKNFDQIRESEEKRMADFVEAQEKETTLSA